MSVCVCERERATWRNCDKRESEREREREREREGLRERVGEISRNKEKIVS